MRRHSTITAAPEADHTSVLMMILIVSLLMLVAGCGSSPSETDTDTENMIARLKRLETRMAAIELNVETRADRYKQIERFMADIERRQADLILSISTLEEKLQTGMLPIENTGAAKKAETAVKVPNPATSGGKAATGKTRYHKVLKGDTVFSISRQYNIQPVEFKRLNGLESDVIKPGQSLRVR